VLRSYSYGPGIDDILSMTVRANDGGTTSVSSVFYYVKDHLGTVHALVDETGSVVERYEYDAWGRVLGVFDGAGNPLAATAVGNRHLWQGREYSWATRLYFFRARWYEPVTGRWLSNDPIGISGGLNQYVFCANDPVNYIDPSGLWTEKGHNKLGRYGGGKFDYAKLDRNYPATLTNPGGHFKKIGDAVHNAMEAARYGESEEFEYAVHEVQDYYSHRGAGITTPGEHVRHGTSPDNPNSEKKRDRYKEADKITRMLEDIWDDYNPPNDSDSPPK
jgi:RHS repeat-associated protein